MKAAKETKKHVALRGRMRQKKEYPDVEGVVLAVNWWFTFTSLDFLLLQRSS